ncbi:MAG: 16S rRNA (adenine(1518)-N(6)/adenine(1519)-N(6))-dimethyltransferase RsmA [Candidatus Wolfebacteria bacterium]|nr:16S rRNA (adenine(1518)-N(6)/adenine(1519)-N(6))-dimethyltransferase RsmA [Candidatus Wolfebacteria bacterium]
MEIKALKKFGQNFLKNKTKLEEIAQAADISAGDVIIEIGPGHGELTEELRSKNKEVRVVAIEKDERLVKELRGKIYGLGWNNVEVISDDALKILKSYTLNLKSYKIVGNIPYYITGHLFRIISELENKPERLVFTVQKEVAERICAKPGEMNLLSASIQIWSKPEIVSYIPKTDFEPVPKVDSAVIRLTTNDLQLTIEEFGKYYDFIHLLFKQPRKTILNNLRLTTYDKRQVADNHKFLIKKLESWGINPKARPQDLNVEKIVELSKLLESSS